MQHEESKLTKKDIRRKKDALKMAELLILQHTALEEVSFDSMYINTCLKNIRHLKWWKRPSRFVVSLSMGYALGACLERYFGFEWMVYKDFLGKNIALKHRASGVICFPISTVSQRLKEKNYTFVPTYINSIKSQINHMVQVLPKLHYVSQGNSPDAHLKGVQKALQAGCQWVQLRMKETEASVFLQTAQEAKKMCGAHKALLTINDAVEIAQKVQADGLHLGKKDMSPTEARSIVGPDMLIGATVNDWQDIEAVHQQPINYLGLGPLKFTSTKKQLSPVLGIEGYRQLMEKMQQHAIYLPVLAIGGIELNDVEALHQTGVHGIAVSGLLYKASDAASVVSAVHRFFS